MKSRLESCLDDNIEVYSESFDDICLRDFLEECTSDELLKNRTDSSSERGSEIHTYSSYENCSKNHTEFNSENYSGIDTDSSSSKRLKDVCCSERSVEDELFMKKAIVRAKTAAKHGEVPVGAIIVQNGVVISDGRNMREGKENALAHAEIIAIERACRKLGRWRLHDCQLYVTLEPCPMCAGAIVNSRIERVVFGAYDKKAGAYGSVFNMSDFPLNHFPKVEGGVLEEKCASLLSVFFKELRQKKKEEKTKKENKSPR